MKDGKKTPINAVSNDEDLHLFVPAPPDDEQNATSVNAANSENLPPTVVPDNENMIITVSDDEDLHLFVPAPPDDDQ